MQTATRRSGHEASALLARLAALGLFTVLSHLSAFKHAPTDLASDKLTCLHRPSEVDWCQQSCNLGHNSSDAARRAFDEMRASPFFKTQESFPPWFGRSKGFGGPRKHSETHVTFTFNMKAAVTSMQKYMHCEYANQSEYVRVNAMIVRDPLARFVSGVQELLNRYLNAGNVHSLYCVDARCLEFQFMLQAQRSESYWMRLLPTLDLARRSDLSRLLEAFYRDVSCCNRFLADEHLFSQVGRTLTPRTPNPRTPTPWMDGPTVHCI